MSIRTFPAVIAIAIAVAVAAESSRAAAQVHDPGTESPLALTVAPPDPVAYHALRARLRTLLSERRYAEAEPLAERVTREYPRDGMNWLELARAKSGLKKHLEAAGAYERAGPLIGWGFWYSPRVNAAGEYVAAGNLRAALDLLRQEMFANRSPLRRELYELPYLAPLRGDPEFRELAGRPDTAGWSRDYGWRRDLELLYGEIKRVNPDYHDEPFPVEFERRYAELWTRVPRLTDEQIYVEMNRVLAVLRQGHTSMLAYPEEKRVPVTFYGFPEGIFIVNAIDEYSALVGARVLTVGNTPAEEALRRVSELLSVDGDMEYLLSAPSRLRQMSLLVGLGIAASTDTLRLVVQPRNGSRRTVDVAAEPRLRVSGNRLAPPPGVPVPLFLRNADQMHWEHPLPEHDALYVQLNGVANDADETLPEFGRRLWTLLSESRPRNLILDLRHNGGGATALYPEFARTVIAYSRDAGNQVYVLIGRRTYSAAANLITDLERFVDPVFVGEASSECCNLFGDPSPLVLPYSGVSGAVTAVKWNLSRNVFDGRREMSPHVPVQLTAEAFFAGRDPALEAIFRLIASSAEQAKR